MPQPFSSAQQTTISASTAETTIVTANPNSGNALAGLIISTLNAVAGTLTLRESTGGATKLVIDYPSTAAAPVNLPLNLMFEPPIQQPINANWTLQASANAASYRVTAIFEPEV